MRPLTCNAGSAKVLVPSLANRRQLKSASKEEKGKRVLHVPLCLSPLDMGWMGGSVYHLIQGKTTSKCIQDRHSSRGLRTDRALSSSGRPAVSLSFHPPLPSSIRAEQHPWRSAGQPCMHARKLTSEQAKERRRARKRQSRGGEGGISEGRDQEVSRNGERRCQMSSDRPMRGRTAVDPW